MKDKITIEILWQAHVGLEQGSAALARKLVKIVMYQPRKRPLSAGMVRPLNRTELHGSKDICILLAR